MGNLCKQGWQNIFVGHSGMTQEMNKLTNEHFNSSV